ncbi:hypothetical protein [Streptosporangium saharense]|uniref:hypothetical protein n=1 Tax=Streptosporangium saharense TaxID=1706840 RepID=UPI00331B8130
MNSVKVVGLDLHGVRSVGTAVSVRSVPTGRRGLLRAYYTKIDYFRNGDRHSAEIEGRHAEGEEIPITYDPEDLSVVDSEPNLVRMRRGVVALVVIVSVEIVGVAVWFWYRRFRRSRKNRVISP